MTPNKQYDNSKKESSGERKRGKNVLNSLSMENPFSRRGRVPMDGCR
jgi:hypothetical protein